MKINNTTLLLALLVVVVVIAGIHAIQLYSLSSVIKSGAFAVGSGSQPSGSQSGGSSPLSGIATQVGGCGG